MWYGVGMDQVERDRYHRLLTSRTKWENGCALYQGRPNHAGYGRVGKNGRHLAHRLSWRLYRGEIPRGTCVLHKCDQRACINPQHLFLGTRTDNHSDMVAKGRARFPNPRFVPRGEKHYCAKLTEKDVVEIRRLAATRRHTQREIAERFGVIQQTISLIVRGQRWAKSS